MKQKRILTIIGGFLSASLAVGTASAASPATPALPVAKAGKEVTAAGMVDATYTGSAACSPCHRKSHDDWKNTWHANMHRQTNPSIVVADFNNVEITYKDVEIEGPEKKKVKISPAIRLSREGDTFRLTLLDRDAPSNNQTYDIGYVFGGNWNQHFEAKVGPAYYPTPMRWIVADSQWTTKPFNDIWWVADGTPDGRPRKPEEMPKTKTGDATCDGCHTTGFSISKSKETGRWAGKEIELGIGCEACHGPGSNHVKAKNKASIINPLKLNSVQQDQVCGQCHSRVTNAQEKELLYPLGFVPENTDLAQRARFWTYSSSPKNFWANGFASKNRQQYHDVQFSRHTAAGVTCITCHDVHSPRKGGGQLRMAKEKVCVQCHKASAEMFKDSTMARKGVGCTDCHMARIATRSDPTVKNKNHWDATSHTFAVVMPEAADKLKMKSSCDTCHEGTDRTAKGSARLGQEAAVKTKIAEVEKAVASSGKKTKNANEAERLLAIVKDDESFGAHNPQKAMRLLDKALGLITRK